MSFPLYFIYVVYTAVLGLIALALVPKRCFKKLSLHAIFLGGLYDVFWIAILDLIGAGGYINYGPFAFLVPFFPPIAWTIFYIMYLYILPKKTPWNYFLAIIAAGYSVIFSNILQNLGIFKWNFGRVIFPFILYFIWFTSVTFIYSHYILKNVRK